MTASGGFSYFADGDPQRKFTFDASSDTALQMTFGDSGTTATQIFTISGGAGVDDDDTVLVLAGGSSGAASEGAFLKLEGNEDSDGGGVYLSGGNGGTATVNIVSAATNSDITLNAADDVIFQAQGVTKFTMDETGQFIGAGTATIGWAVVDGADNTACSTQCTTPAVFGFNLAAGATAPVIVGPSDAVADICLCAGGS
jgi:hypothetical protein